MNKFLIYRVERVKWARDHGLKDDCLKSFIDSIPTTWRELPPVEDNRYAKLAEEQKKDHMEKYPGYKYSPRTQEEIDADRAYDKAEKRRKLEESKELARQLALETKEVKKQQQQEKKQKKSSSQRSQEPPSQVQRLMSTGRRPGTVGGSDQQLPRHLSYYSASAWGPQGPPS